MIIKGVRSGTLVLAMLQWLGPTVATGQNEVFVANLGSDDVSVFDVDSRQVVATIPVGTDPDGVAVTPGESEVFVANFLSDDVSIIDTVSRSVVGTVFVGSGPVGVAVTPDGQTVLVANRESGTISVVDVASRRVTGAIPVDRGPNGIAVHPSGQFAYVTNSFTRQPGVVSVVDLAAREVATSIAVNHSPGRVAFAPDGRCAYVTNFRSVNVSIIDTTSHTVVATVPVFGRPTGVAVNPNGAYVYVATLGGRVNVLDANTHELHANIGVGAEPYAITTIPSGAFGFTADFRSGTSTLLDTVEHEVREPFVVGQQPFALAVSCRGSQCDAPPVSPRPTRTATNTRPPTPTRTIGPSNTPRPTATPAPPAVLEVGSGVPDTEGRVSIDVSLSGRRIGGMQNDLYIDNRVMRLIGCAINPAIGLFPLGPSNPTCLDDTSIGPCKTLSSATYDCSMTSPPGICPSPNVTVFRAIISSLAAPNSNEIPAGVLYTCVMEVTDLGALPIALNTAEAIASDTVGNRIDFEVRPGQVGAGELPPPPPADTPTPLDTPTVTATPSSTMTPAVISIETLNTGEGEVVVSVILAGHRETLGGMQNDILFDNTVLNLDARNCTINPQIGNIPFGPPPDNITCFDDTSIGPCKTLHRDLHRCDASPRPMSCPDGAASSVSAVRVIIAPTGAPNNNEIPDGTLYTCRFAILDPERLPTVLTNTFVVGSSPQGSRVNTMGTDGLVFGGAVSSEAGLGTSAGSGNGCQLEASQSAGGSRLLPLLSLAAFWIIWSRALRRSDDWQ